MSSGIRTLLLLSIAIVIGAPCLPASAAVAADVRRHVCERDHSRAIRFSNSEHADNLTVRASGASCNNVKITVTLRAAHGQVLWSEWSYFNLIKFDRFPNEPGQRITLEDVIAATENWVSLATTSNAPAWPRGAAQPLSSSKDDIAQYETKISKERNEQFRHSNIPLICIPIGSESGHCIVMDKAIGRAIVMYDQGV